MVCPCNIASNGQEPRSLDFFSFYLPCPHLATLSNMEVRTSFHMSCRSRPAWNSLLCSQLVLWVIHTRPTHPFLAGQHKYFLTGAALCPSAPQEFSSPAAGLQIIVYERSLGFCLRCKITQICQHFMSLAMLIMIALLINVYKHV